MSAVPFQANPLSVLPSNGRLLFVTRAVRLFAYGFLSVVLVLYLAELNLSEAVIGLILTLTLIGDTAISLWLTTHADRIGRQKVLIAGASLMIFGGVIFAGTRNIVLLMIGATIGVISPSGNEVGPFLSIEQAALSQVVADEHRTRVFAWYTLIGSLATAVGALFGGVLVQELLRAGVSPLASYRVVVIAYATAGAGIVGLFSRLSPDIEVTNPVVGPSFPTPGLHRSVMGLSHSRDTVLKLAALFSLDAFAGGFVVQSLIAYWFHIRFNANPATLGGIFFCANLLAGLSAMAAAHVAQRIGLINTMVFTHLPSNILLILVPLMPNLTWAIAVLLIRFSISQMDVPTRQSYTMAVVRPEERSAAGGVTAVARTTGAAVSPMFAAMMLGNAHLISMPFFLAGSMKILYDLLLYRGFRTLRAPGEEHLGNTMNRAKSGNKN
jgi:MFS family permease